jgi:hypothetical protein
VAAEVNANFDAVETAVDDNDARLSVLEDTASGIDFVTSDSPANFSSSSGVPTIAASVTVTVPGPGFVKVHFSADLAISHANGGGDSEVLCSLTTDTAFVNGTGRLQGSLRVVEVISAQPTGSYRRPVDSLGVYPAGAAGSVTLNALCETTGSSASLSSRALVATFYGERY